jgi:UDP-N-acetylenolpyruvoylglucosamine reductase
MTPAGEARSGSKAAFAVRYVLPAAIVVAAIVVLVFNHSIDGLEGAAMFVGAAGAILLLNVLYRVGVSGDEERDREAQARDYLDEHGHWPDEEPR